MTASGRERRSWRSKNNQKQTFAQRRFAADAAGSLLEMKVSLYIGAISAGLLLTVGCGSSDVAMPPGYWQIGEIRKVNGTVRSLDDISSGCWGLDIGNRNLEMVNLDADYLVDGLLVTATVRAEGDYTSICGIGQTVSIIDIRKR